MAHLFSEDLYGEATFSAETTSTAAGSGAYNELYYNENVYNAAILVMAFFETIGSSDARTYVDSLTPTELITLTENLQRFFNGQILMDMISESDTLTKNALLAKAETMFESDFLTLTFLKALIETVSMADIRTMVYTTSKVDAVNLSDLLTKAITDKRINDDVRLNDWFTIKNAPQSDPWS